MSEPFIGEIRMFGGNFAPRGWALCNGQIISIAQNTALFSLLGTTYGGNGQTTFGLPNMQGRMPMHAGQGPGLTPRVLGEQVGAPTHTLTSAEMPAHTHGLNAAAAGTTGTPGPGVALAAGAKVYRTPASNLVNMAAGTTSSGGGQAHENRQPYLAVTFIIAMQGVFPARN
ncbi:MAG: phage tail protein [Burkholderiales bacterium]|uniref:phage tail protein n=1 Tax=Inhella sp. TaxID=1921806 RepID=UPI001ACAFA05|nr:phage tail protein [Burkholderiales bacterium]